MVFAITTRLWYYQVSVSLLYVAQSYSGEQFNIKGENQLKGIMTIPFINSVSFLFGMLFEFIAICLNKNKKSERYQEVMTITPMNRTIMEEDDKIKTKPSFYMYLLLGSANLFPCLIYFAFLSTQSLTSLQILFSICLTIILSYFFLRFKLNRHHYFALILLTVNILIYCSVTYEEILKSFNEYSTLWLMIVGIILFVIFSSIREILEKHLLTTYQVRSSLLLFHEGWVALVVYSFSFIIIHFTLKCPEDPIDTFCEQFTWASLEYDLKKCFGFDSMITFFFFMYFISTFLVNYLRIEINNLLSPTHRYVSEMISQFYWYWINLVRRKNDPIGYKIGNFFHVLFLLLACLVFNEYIIIRICGLDRNTYNEITERATNETKDDESFNNNIQIELCPCTELN